jgi:uncharacterized protein (DUF4415 family)
VPAKKPSKPSIDRTDWARLRQFSDDEIERMALADEDNPATSQADWADAVVTAPPRKTRIHASLDQDVVDWFRGQGRGYQTRMNAVLRRYMDAHRKAG